MNILNFKRNIDDLNRLRVILSVVFEAGGGVLIEKVGLKYLVSWKCRIHCFFNPPKTKNCLMQKTLGGTERLSPDVLRIVLEKLGPTFIKLGQILSLRADVVGGFATWYCRPDLKKKMIVSAFLFLTLYFVYFWTLIAISPGYVEQVWNLEAISGILIIGIPLEELLFAFSFGFIWSSIYEHLTWKKLKLIK